MGHLLEAVAEPENLRLAFWKAARGKADRSSVRAFRENLGEELRGMRAGILSGNYPVGQYQRFVVHDPKGLNKVPGSQFSIKCQARSFPG